MKKLVTPARYLMGLIFFVFGLNGFLGFMQPPPPSEAGLKFIMSLVETGYMMPFVKGVEVLVGIMLLAGLFVPLALVLIAPIVLNIFLFHTLLDPSGAIMGSALVVLNLFLAWGYRSSYTGVLKK